MGEIQRSTCMVREIHSCSCFVLNEKWRTNREHGDYGDGGALTLDEIGMVNMVV
jgi:hypothetical protein